MYDVWLDDRQKSLKLIHLLTSVHKHNFVRANFKSKHLKRLHCIRKCRRTVASHAAGKQREVELHTKLSNYRSEFFACLKHSCLKASELTLKSLICMHVTQFKTASEGKTCIYCTLCKVDLLFVWRGKIWKYLGNVCLLKAQDEDDETCKT